MNTSHICATAKAIDQACRDWTLTEIWRTQRLFSRITLPFFSNARFAILIWEPVLASNITEVKNNNESNSQDNIDLFPAVVLIGPLEIS